MAEILGAVVGAGMGLADLASDAKGTIGKKELVNDLRRKSIEREKKLEALKNRALMQRAAFNEGGKINKDSPPPQILEPEDEMSKNKPTGAMVKQAYLDGQERAFAELGIEKYFEKEAFIIPALKKGWDLLRRGSQAIGLTGAKYKKFTGTTKSNPFTGKTMHTGPAPGKHWSMGTNPAGQASWKKKGWWGRQSTSNKVQAGLGLGALGVGYTGSKLLGAHNKAMSSPKAFKMRKPNTTSARLAAKTYGY